MKVEIQKGTVKHLEFEGTMLDIVSEIGVMLKRIDDHFKKIGKEQAETFELALKAVIDGVVCMREEEQKELDNDIDELITHLEDLLEVLKSES